MLDAGEDPLYLARRVVRMAVEDIGMADPQALVICNAAKDAYDFLGSPEGELAIAEAVIYVATAPKSNAAYVAYGAAKRAAKEDGSLLPPKHILNAPTNLMKSEGYGRGYAYDHDAGGGVLRPGLFPGGTRPPDLLRSARARLRARNQEAPGLLGEASQGQGRTLMLRRLVLAACAIGAAWVPSALRRPSLRRPLGGQAPRSASHGGDTPRPRRSLPPTPRCRGSRATCRIGKMYKAKAVYVQAHCGSKDVPVTLDAQGDRMRVTWDRKVEDLKRCN